MFYDYAPAVYDKISKSKMISKFEATAKAIEAVKPKMYLPSAVRAASWILCCHT